MSRTLNKVEWVKPTHQARSQETLERILEAAEELVSERGFDNATVSEIVRRANSSVGAMYARFNDKDSLLVCLHERFCEQALATADTARRQNRTARPSTTCTPSSPRWRAGTGGRFGLWRTDAMRRHTHA